MVWCVFQINLLLIRIMVQRNGQTFAGVQSTYMCSAIYISVWEDKASPVMNHHCHVIKKQWIGVYTIFRHIHISYCDIVGYKMLLILQYIPLGLFIPMIVIISQSKYHHYVYIYIYWLVVGNICFFNVFHLLGVIIPAGFQIFQRGRSTHQPVYYYH